MSSIHDALRRARRMNEASGQVLNPPQADLPLKKPRSKAPFLSMIVILAVAAGAAAWLVLRPGETEAPLAEKSQTLAKAETPGAVAPASAKASPAAKSLLKPSEPEKAAPTKKLLKAAAPQTRPLKARPTPGVIKKKAAARVRTQPARASETPPRRDEPGLKARPEASPPQAVRAAARPVRDPEAAVKHFNLGRAAQAKGRYSEAVSEYRQALRLNPNLAQAYLNLGNIFFFHDKTLDKAKEMYTRVLKIDPDNKLGHNNLGVIFLRRKLFDQAEAQFMAALNLDQDFADASYNLACLFAQKGMKPKAMAFLLKAARVNPAVREWAAGDHDLQGLADLPEFDRFLRQAAPSRHASEKE